MLTFNLGRKTASASSGEIVEPQPAESDASGVPMSDDHHVPPAEQGDGD